MNYFEETFSFEEVKSEIPVIDLKRRLSGRLQRGSFEVNERSLSKDFQRISVEKDVPMILGIKVRLGNEPIVKDLKKLYQYSGKAIPADLQVLFQKKDIYIIVHAISAVRLSGSAKVDELQYNAEIIEKGSQTVDLLPNTSFRELAAVNLGFQGSLSGNGNFSATLPDTLTQSLLQNEITLGADMKIQLSSNAGFVGKFTYSLKFPVIQSAGIASNFCNWILQPLNTPLLGDQLLIQTVAVPKGTPKITYKVKGVCKADKGLFWRQQTMETAEYNIEVDLI
jgi:hypothetical protein